jgi:uncharacterized protein YkwD
VVCLVNRIRTHHEIPLLSPNDDLSSSAAGHSDDMVSRRYFSHFGPSGSTPFARVAETGYMAGAAGCDVGENLGWGVGSNRGSPLAVVVAWMHSAPHRANILEPRFRDIGVGISRGSPHGRLAYAGTYTLDLGLRTERYSP